MAPVDAETLTREGLVTLEQASRLIGLPRQTLWTVLRRLGAQVRRVGDAGAEVSAIGLADLARVRELSGELDPKRGGHGLAELTSRNGGRRPGSRAPGGPRSLELDLLEARRQADHWRALEERSRVELERVREELAGERARALELERQLEAALLPPGRP